MLTSRALGRDIHFNYFSIALAALFFFPALCYHLHPFTHKLWLFFFFLHRQQALVKYALAAESGLNLAQINAAHLCKVNGCG